RGHRRGEDQQEHMVDGVAGVEQPGAGLAVHGVGPRQKRRHLAAGSKCYTLRQFSAARQSINTAAIYPLSNGDPHMSQVTLAGNPIDVAGHFPKAGDTAPAYTLVDGKLGDVSLDTYTGKRKVLNIVPSLDTPTCATSTRKFN